MSKRLCVVILVSALCCTPHLRAQAKADAAAEKATSIADKTKSMERMAGYFNIYWDAKAGKLWLEIDKWGTEFLYQSSLPAGIGSNDIVLDPRSSFFGISYMDYATPISESIVKRFAARHRLEKKDPSAAVSEAVKPIVYYLDRGAPEPIRSALLEGARWWAQAFEAAGFKNAFRVELMPEGADPM